MTLSSVSGSEGFTALPITTMATEVSSVSQYFESFCPIWDIKTSVDSFSPTRRTSIGEMKNFATSLANVLQNTPNVHTATLNTCNRISVLSMPAVRNVLASDFMSQRPKSDPSVLHAVNVALHINSESSNGVYDEPWESLPLRDIMEKPSSRTYKSDLIATGPFGVQVGEQVNQQLGSFQRVSSQLYDTIPHDNTAQNGLSSSQGIISHEDDYGDNYWSSSIKPTQETRLSASIGSKVKKGKLESMEQPVPESPSLRTLPISSPVRQPGVLGNVKMVSPVWFPKNDQLIDPPTPTRLSMHPSYLRNSGENSIEPIVLLETTCHMRSIFRQNGHNSLADRQARMNCGRDVLASLIDKMAEIDESSPIKKAIRDHEDWDTEIGGTQAENDRNEIDASSPLIRTVHIQDLADEVNVDIEVSSDSNNDDDILIDSMQNQTASKIPHAFEETISNTSIILGDLKSAEETIEEPIKDVKEETFTELSFLGRDLIEDEKRMQEMRARRKKRRVNSNQVTASIDSGLHLSSEADNAFTRTSSTGSFQSNGLPVLSQVSTTEHLTPDCKAIDQNDLAATPQKHPKIRQDVVEARAIQGHAKSRLVDAVGSVDVFTVGTKQCTAFGVPSNVSMSDEVASVTPKTINEKPKTPSTDTLSVMCPGTPSTPVPLSDSSSMENKLIANESKMVGGSSLRRRILQKKRAVTPKWIDTGASEMFLRKDTPSNIME
uniref:Protein kinase domain-containing protein n=1 Tax=Caenorhabditis tropicalis TaxID=1561998 RepID=A0A1I7V1Q3_9PELO